MAEGNPGREGAGNPYHDPHTGQFTTGPHKPEPSKGGFKVVKGLDKASPALVHEMKLKEPKKISELHTLQAEAFTSVLSDPRIKGTILEQVKKHAKEIEVLYASYEPKGAKLTTAYGDGHAYFLVNTNADPGAIFELNTKAKLARKNLALSYSERKGMEGYLEHHDRNRAVSEMCRMTAIHELAHMVDRAHNGTLTDSWLEWLDARKFYTRELMTYLGKTISGYSRSSPSEAMTETVVKYIVEGEAGDPDLDDWAHTVIGLPWSKAAKKK